MTPEHESCCHKWESGAWGVIIGLSRCLVCGKISGASDFPWIRRDETSCAVQISQKVNYDA